MMTKTSHSDYREQDKLNALTELTINSIDKVYEYFDTEYTLGRNIIFSRCFIHGGDNNTALNLYHNADYRIHYKCRTHQCEEHFGTSLLSMVRGGLSRLRYNWKLPGDKQVSFEQTIKFLLSLFEVNYKNIEGIDLDHRNHKFCKVVDTFTSHKKSRQGFSKDFYREKVEIPSQYYLQRGYSIEILDQFDVGICKTYGKPMFNRSVVPIYDENGEKIIACTGRSIFERCKKCKSYHNPDKPCHNFPKWKHSNGFEKEETLYNYWNAKEHILTTGTIILVESPGNVWRLEEAGIHNAVALFGTTLNSGQLSLIDESGALNIVLLMDNDPAGKEASERIKKQCERTYRVYSINIDVDDVAVMSANEITQDIKPLIDKIIGELV